MWTLIVTTEKKTTTTEKVVEESKMKGQLSASVDCEYRNLVTGEPILCHNFV